MLELLILFIYAILWQQIIKKTELSIAYMNKSLALFWSMLWSFFIFEEKISINNIIGVVIILLGIVIINTEKEEEKEYVDSYVNSYIREGLDDERIQKTMLNLLGVSDVQTIK